MGKRNLTLYVDDELVNLATARGINISRLFNEIINTELSIKDLSDATTKEELINKLKAKVSILSEELKLQMDKLKMSEEEVKKLQGRLEESNKKSKKDEKEVILWSQ